MNALLKFFRSILRPLYVLQIRIHAPENSKAADKLAVVLDVLSVIIVFVVMWPFGSIRGFAKACGIALVFVFLCYVLADIILFLPLFLAKVILWPPAEMYILCGNRLRKKGVFVRSPSPEELGAQDNSSFVMEEEEAETGLRYFIEQDKKTSPCRAEMYEDDVKEPWYHKVSDPFLEFFRKDFS